LNQLRVTSGLDLRTATSNHDLNGTCEVSGGGNQGGTRVELLVGMAVFSIITFEEGDFRLYILSKKVFSVRFFCHIRSNRHNCRKTWYPHQ
jgi:hypothetical protein